MEMLKLRWQVKVSYIDLLQYYQQLSGCGTVLPTFIILICNVGYHNNGKRVPTVSLFQC